MAGTRFGRAQKASALLPLALLSVAWTASLATAGSGTSADGSQTLPDGTQVPSQAVRAPASLTAPHTLTPGVHGHDSRLVTTAAASGIPAVAPAAYQRAATVIDAADHGRAGGNVLTDQGVARPGIFGPVLDGDHGTTLIRDTDAGQYDDDTHYDRAVGPMQFIPSTWAIVGVDADNDGRRNPQDINDASLGSAVYLCSGTDDLGTDAGRRAAVYRYNHSDSYVSLVLSLADSYASGTVATFPARPARSSAAGSYSARTHSAKSNRPSASRSYRRSNAISTPLSACATWPNRQDNCFRARATVSPCNSRKMAAASPARSAPDLQWISAGSRIARIASISRSTRARGGANRLFSGASINTSPSRAAASRDNAPDPPAYGPRRLISVFRPKRRVSAASRPGVGWLQRYRRPGTTTAKLLQARRNTAWSTSRLSSHAVTRPRRVVRSP